MIFRRNRMFTESASQWCATIVRCSYRQCRFTNEHFKVTVNERSTSPSIIADKKLHETSIPKTSVFRILHGVLQLYPNKMQNFCFNSCCSMTQLNKWLCKLRFVGIRRKSAMTAQYLMARRESFFTFSYL